MDLSIVIPALNESESLPQLLQEIHQICNKESINYETIVIDDGSSDNTFSVVKALCKNNPTLKIIRFRHNCGKAAALSFGFSKAAGKYIITMDGDLQDNPSEIPGIIALLKGSADMVSGWKKKRHDPWHKRFPSKFFNLILRRVSGLDLHDFNCGLKGYRQEVVHSVNLYGELHRYIPLLAHWNGFQVEEKVVEHRARKHGRSKYGVSRMTNGMFDLITLLFLHRYTSRPLHLFGLVGLVINFFGILILGYFGIEWLITGALHIRPLMLGAMAAILLGFQIISLGLLGEMITQQSKQQFPVARTHGLDEVNT